MSDSNVFVRDPVSWDRLKEMVKDPRMFASMVRGLIQSVPTDDYKTVPIDEKVELLVYVGNERNPKEPDPKIRKLARLTLARHIVPGLEIKRNSTGGHPAHYGPQRFRAIQMTIEFFADSINCDLPKREADNLRDMVGYFRFCGNNCAIVNRHDVLIGGFPVSVYHLECVMLNLKRYEVIVNDSMFAVIPRLFRDIAGVAEDRYRDFPYDDLEWLHWEKLAICVMRDGERSRNDLLRGLGEESLAQLHRDMKIIQETCEAVMAKGGYVEKVGYLLWLRVQFKSLLFSLKLWPRKMR